MAWVKEAAGSHFDTQLYFQRLALPRVITARCRSLRQRQMVSAPADAMRAFAGRVPVDQTTACWKHRRESPYVLRKGAERRGPRHPESFYIMRSDSFRSLKAGVLVGEHAHAHCASSAWRCILPDLLGLVLQNTEPLVPSRHALNPDGFFGSHSFFRQYASK